MARAPSVRLGNRDDAGARQRNSDGALSIDAALEAWAACRAGRRGGNLRTGIRRQDDAYPSHHCRGARRWAGRRRSIDAEHALDPIYARKLGVDVDNLLVSQPDNGEQALEIAETLIRSNGVDIIVVDSVAALVPRAGLEGDMGDPRQMGLQARLMSQALRKLTAIVSKSHTVPDFHQPDPRKNRRDVRQPRKPPRAGARSKF